MTFVPTLNFNGKCREAMEPYKRAFSGEVTALPWNGGTIFFVSASLNRGGRPITFTALRAERMDTMKKGCFRIFRIAGGSPLK